MFIGCARADCVIFGRAALPFLFVSLVFGREKKVKIGVCICLCFFLISEVLWTDWIAWDQAEEGREPAGSAVLVPAG